jgi:hypothetical protein
MADTMATPCRYALLRIHRFAVSRDGKPHAFNSVEQERASHGNPAKSLIFRRHLVRDQEAGGSNPLAPTISFLSISNP